jgi:subtilase family serine protease
MKACQFKLSVDPDNKIAEENEGNNTTTLDMPFCGQYPPAPDLRVNSLKAEKITSGGKEAFLVTAECENAGNTVGNPTFEFWWYLNDEKYEYTGYLAMTNFGDFPAPLQKFNVVATVPFAKFPAGQNSVRLKFEIDSRANVKESNWENNVREIVLEKQ